MAEDQDNVKSALQMLYELEGRDYAPAPEQKPQPTIGLKPLDENSMWHGEAEDVQPSTMSYPEQMKNVWETVKPTQQGSKDAAAIAASSIYGAPMDIMGLLHGAREIVKGRIPDQHEMELPGGSHYLEERAKSVGTLSQEPSGAAQATGIIGSIVADPLAAAGKLGTLAAAVPAAAKSTGAVEKALTTAQKAERELSPLGLYSQSAEVARKLNQPDTPASIIRYLTNNGANKEELIAAGILDEAGKPSQEFMAQARVNPQELVGKIQSSFPEVKETLLESPKYEISTFYEPVFQDPRGGVISLGRYQSERAADASARDYLRTRPNMGEYSIKSFDLKTPVPVQYEVEFGPKQYPKATTEGGENYRELLLHTPESVGNQSYIEGHYGAKYPNVLAHIRMQDIPDPDTGRKVLRIEEIQSDWAQKGSKAGFKMNETELKAAKEKANNLEQKLSELDEQAAGLFGLEGYATPEYTATRKQSEEVSKQLQNIRGQISANEKGKALPANQYVKNTEKWTDLAVKRALKEAADNPDYSKLQLTAGSMQYERWNKTKEAEGVAKYYDTKLKSSLEKWAKKLDPEAKVEKKVYQEGMDADEELRMNLSIAETSRLEAEDRVRQIQQMLDDESLHANQRRELEYELDMAEAEAQDFAEQFAAFEREAEDLGQGQPKHEFYEVNITPKMRESIAKGLPRFYQGGKVVAETPKISDNPIVHRALMLTGGRPVNS